MSYHLRHWTDGANTAYLAFADGTHGAGRADADARRRRQRAAEARRRDLSGAGRGAGAGVDRAVAAKRRRLRPSAPCRRASIFVPKATTRLKRPRRLSPSSSAACFPVEGIVRPAAEGGFPVSVSTRQGLWRRKPMRSAFRADGVAVSGGTRTGLLYGLITLGQILRGARRHPETFVFPAEGEIRDEPALGWRGMPSRCRPAVLRQRRDRAAS